MTRPANVTKRPPEPRKQGITALLRQFEQARDMVKNMMGNIGKAHRMKKNMK